MIGIFSKTSDPNLSKIAAMAGLDFVIIDMEHGISNLKKVDEHINYSKAAGINSYVRVENSDSINLAKVLELDPSGIMIPNIEDYSHWKKVKKKLFFHPIGKRGICRYVPAANFGAMEGKSYFEKENKRKIIVQIEGKKSLSEISKFIGDSEIETLFIGPYDLSQSLGLPGQISHPKVEEKVREIIIECTKRGKNVGIFVDNQHNINHYKNKGVNFIACSVDYNIYLEALKKILN